VRSALAYPLAAVVLAGFVGIVAGAAYGDWNRISKHDEGAALRMSGLVALVSGARDGTFPARDLVTENMPFGGREIHLWPHVTGGDLQVTAYPLSHEECHRLLSMFRTTVEAVSVNGSPPMDHASTGTAFCRDDEWRVSMPAAADPARRIVALNTVTFHAGRIKDGATDVGLPRRP